MTRGVKKPPAHIHTKHAGSRKEECNGGHAMYELLSAAVTERHQSGADNREVFYGHGVRKHRRTLVDSYRRVCSGFFSYILEEFLTCVVSAHSGLQMIFVPTSQISF